MHVGVLFLFRTTKRVSLPSLTYIVLSALPVAPSESAHIASGSLGPELLHFDGCAG